MTDECVKVTQLKPFMCSDAIHISQLWMAIPSLFNDPVKVKMALRTSGGREISRLSTLLYWNHVNFRGEILP